MKPPSEFIPVSLRSEAEEEAWWQSVAAERGADLAEWDNPKGKANAKS